MRPRLILLFALALGCHARAQQGAVLPTGAMRNTMFNGQLAALISMDSLATEGMYGIGPLAYLRGELLLLDGHCYVATATSDSSMQVLERSDVGAPFFVRQQVRNWQPVALPDSVKDLPGLDGFLTSLYAALPAPFAFRITGHFRALELHLVDVPPGTEVRGPADAHAHNKHFTLSHREAEALGFFSTQHRTVFTHHDTNIHVHAISSDRRLMGHADGLLFDAAEVQLFVAVRE